MVDNTLILADIKRYAEMGKLSVFVGAGVSRLSGYPSWYDLVQSMADEIGCTYIKDEKGNAVFSSEELLKIPQMYHLNKGEGTYRNKVKQGFQNACSPNEIHDLILSLHPNHILTTNYDTLLEETAIKFGRNYSVLNSNQVVSKAETENYIIKVHGDFDADFVLKEQDYLDYENNYILIDNVVKTIFATNLVIFIGYGLNDYNIKLILNWVKRVQADSFVMPVFIHTGDKLNDLEKSYQEGRGLRILDSTNYINTTDYSDKYKSVLERILVFNNINDLSTDSKKLQYMFDKISGIRNLKYIRKEDFNSIFKDEYELNDEWKIVNKVKSYDVVLDDKDGLKTVTNIKIDYLEDFYEHEDKYMSINIEQSKVIREFLHKLSMAGFEGSYKVPNITINSIVFLNQYEEMKLFCGKEYVDIYSNYVKAYYLGQLGEYARSYELYTNIVVEAKKSGQWDIYFFSQINRQYLFSIIKQRIAQTSGFQGVVNFGKELRPFYESFLKKLTYEMRNVELETQYNELPYEIRAKYPFLKDFSKANYNISQYYKLVKDKYEVEKSLYQYTMNFGLSKFDKVKLRMLEAEKFLYENMILFENFDENKIYVRNLMISWLEAYFNDITKNIRGPFGDICNSRYSFNVQDIILISKNFKRDDIQYLTNKIDLCKLPFNEIEILEDYINTQIDRYNNMFGSQLSGGEIFVWSQYGEEIRNLLLVSPYFVTDNDCKQKVIQFIISISNGHFSISDRIKIIKKWLFIAETKGTSQIIEKWLYDKIGSIFKKDIPAGVIHSVTNDISEIVQLLCTVVEREKYNVEDISELIVENKNNSFCNIKCLEGLYSMLNDEAKKVFDDKYGINNVFELMNRGYSNTIPSNCSETDIIKRYFDNILKTRQDNKEKGITVSTMPSQEEEIGEVAVYMLMRDIPSSFTLTYSKICEEYDFLLCPETFDSSLFQVKWLFNYSNELYKKIKNNHYQRKIVNDAIEKAFDSG